MEAVGDAFDHVPSGRLLVHTVEENEEFTVPSAWCRVRSYHAPLATAAAQGDVAHRLQVWPAPQEGVLVLKAVP
jgi:hypothetical protein